DATFEHDAPLVPRALLPLVRNPAGDDERLVAIAPFGVELNRRGVRRQIRNDADVLQIDVGPNDDRAAVLADRLHAARPLVSDRRAAVRAAGGPARHPRTVPAASGASDGVSAAAPYGRSRRLTFTACASRRSRSDRSKS